MRLARVVIGANFGDEGKGLITDYFASEGDSLVVRFNGGAQAGHTVVTSEGNRHVFGHFGSGTLVGAATFLSRFFIVNPILFAIEYQKLRDMNVEPILYVDEKCRVTTPFDMILNQIVEEHRGDGRHGSCGIGIHETVERHNTIPIFVSDLSNLPSMRRFLKVVRDSYVPNRLAKLGVKEIPERYKQFLLDDSFIETYLSDVKLFLQVIAGSFNPILLACPSENIIFEGAQGLLLDADHKFFPYVTCSKTGLHNPILLSSEFGIKEMAVTYVTRCYVTRHGPGPFPNEVSLNYILTFYPEFKELTNVSNKYQGDLRLGFLDSDLLSNTIFEDYRKAVYRDLKLDFNLAVTCLDQMDSKDRSVRILGELYPLVKYFSFGPSRESIKKVG